jgi:hypothetical protein
MQVSKFILQLYIHHSFSDILCNYACFIAINDCDFNKAEEINLKALSIEYNNTNVLINVILNLI